jgi:glycosidase
LQMLFDFPLMQAMYLALARSDARPIRRALKGRPAVPDESQWAVFVRNHDELTLDQLSDKERQEVFAAFGPEEDMQLFGRGLRRRLPPMLDGDPARIRLVYSLLFSLPGTPVLFYGEEIGMGENLAVPGRLSVRTPMQWADERNAGFSTATPGRLSRPVVEGRFGPMAVNATAQRRDPDSLLNWMERLIRRRRECPEFGWGTPMVLDVSDASILAHQCEWEGSRVFAIHNLSPEPREVKLPVDGAADGDRLVNLLAHADPDLPLDGPAVELKLEGYAYRWYRLQQAGTTTTP